MGGFPAVVADAQCQLGTYLKHEPLGPLASGPTRKLGTGASNLRFNKPSQGLQCVSGLAIKALFDYYLCLSFRMDMPTDERRLKSTF